MYYILKDMEDAEILSEEIIQEDGAVEVAGRIKEIISMLDSSYGVCRKVYSMGGYVYYFPDSSTYAYLADRLYRLYHINPEDYEYSDIICENNGVEWHEKLFMLSSDDSIVFIYPSQK